MAASDTFHKMDWDKHRRRRVKQFGGWEEFVRMISKKGLH